MVVLDTMLIFWLLDELVVNDRIVLFMTDGDVGMIELVWIIELLLSVVFLLRRGLKLKVTGVILVILAVGVEVIDRL